MASSHPVIVVGSVSADVTALADRSPAPGETMFGTAFSLAAGGKGANQAMAAARAGAETFFVACVGDDPFEAIVTDALTAAGVETRYVRRIPGEGTGIAHIRVDTTTGENDIVIVPRANSRLTRDDVDAAIDEIGAVGGVLLTQLETPFDAGRHALARAHEAGLTVILDPAPAAAMPDDVWATVDMVTPNETEAAVLTGVAVTDRASAIRAGEWFVARGVATALITMAGSGAVAVTREGAREYEPFVVDAVDTTAAGDAFAGGLASALASGSDLDAAVRRAMATGAIAVTRVGAAPSIPTAAEVDAFFAEHSPRHPISR